MPTRFCFLILSSLLLVPDAPLACAQGSPFRFDVQHHRIELQLYAPHIIRIRVSPDSTIPTAPSLSVIAVPAVFVATSMGVIDGPRRLVTYAVLPSGVMATAGTFISRV